MGERKERGKEREGERTSHASSSTDSAFMRKAEREDRKKDRDTEGEREREISDVMFKKVAVVLRSPVGFLSVGTNHRGTHPLLSTPASSDRLPQPTTLFFIYRLLLHPSR